MMEAWMQSEEEVSLEDTSLDDASREVIDVAFISLESYKSELADSAPSLIELIERLEAVARPQRIERAKHLRQPLDRLASLAAGVLLDRVTASVTEQEQIPIVEGRYGKPDFIEDSGLHFNLSHSKEAVCCAVSRQPVGIDIEGLVDPYEDLCAMCLTAREHQHLKACQDRRERIRLFTRLWTRKEALGKYLGLGIDESVLNTDVFSPPLQTLPLETTSLQAAPLQKTRLKVTTLRSNTSHLVPSRTSISSVAHTLSSTSLQHGGSEKNTARTIRTFDLETSCLSLCGHGVARAVRYTLDEVLAAPA